MHPVSQKGISSVFREQFGRGIKLKYSENVEGDFELKESMYILVYVHPTYVHTLRATKSINLTFQNHYC